MEHRGGHAQRRLGEPRVVMLAHPEAGQPAGGEVLERGDEVDLVDLAGAEEAVGRCNGERRRRPVVSRLSSGSLTSDQVRLVG
jgi:hypothetical protein